MVDYFQMGQINIFISDYKDAIYYLEKVDGLSDSLSQFASYYLGKAYVETGEKNFALQAFNNSSFYNFDMEQILPITIHPFAIIDDTLNFNMKLRTNEVVGKISGIIEEVKQVNGTLISIWHNDTFSDEGAWKGWRNVYEDMVKLIKA